MIEQGKGLKATNNTHNKSTTHKTLSGKGVKPTTSCYGLEPGNDIKHNKRTVFLVCGIGCVNCKPCGYSEPNQDKMYHIWSGGR